MPCRDCGCTDESACPGGCAWDTAERAGLAPHERICTRCAAVADGTAPAPDSLVECQECGRRQSVRFAEALANGWPLCHNATMRLVQAPEDITAAAKEALQDLGSILLLAPPFAERRSA